MLLIFKYLYPYNNSIPGLGSAKHTSHQWLYKAVSDLLYKDLLNKQTCWSSHLVCSCIRKICFFLWSQTPFTPACTACHKLATCKTIYAHMKKCRTWMRLWGCWPWCHSTEVIIICIGHDAPAPKPQCLKKHLEIICVHLGLLFFYQQQQLCSGIALPCHHHPLINTNCSSSRHRVFKPPKPVSKSKSKLSASESSAAAFLTGSYEANNLTAQRSVCGAGRAWGFLSLSFPPLHLFAWDTIPWVLAVTVCIKPE